jgi:hypothetical protein
MATASRVFYEPEPLQIRATYYDACRLEKIHLGNVPIHLKGQMFDSKSVLIPILLSEIGEPRQQPGVEDRLGQLVYLFVSVVL